MAEETKIIKIEPPKEGLIMAAIIVFFLAVFLGVVIRNEWKKHDYIGKPAESPYTITISGEGKVAAVPDIAQISLGIQTEKKKVADAQKENTEKMNQIIKELKGMDIDSKDIKTANYNIYPQYDWFGGKQTLRGYQIDQTVVIKIRDLEKIGKILEMAGRIGANQIGGLNFTIDEPEKLRQEARIKALVNAKEKAEALARVAGAKLGKIVSFSETGGGMPPIYNYYEMEGLGIGGGKTPTPNVEPGSQEIIIDVTVSYEVL